MFIQCTGFGREQGGELHAQSCNFDQQKNVNMSSELSANRKSENFDG